MATRAGLFLIITLAGVSIARETPDLLVAWNVGQGQWITIVNADTCSHFDAGGEFAPWRAIERLCRGRVNHVYLSHWDLDHVGFARRLRQRLAGACLAEAPTGRAPPRKAYLTNDFPRCRTNATSWVDTRAHDENGRSRVSLYLDVLVPGDAPRAAERRLLPKIIARGGARILILGHHGSRTSTARELLRALPRLRVAIASARRERYGHPHVETRRALADAGVALLTTEDWGSLAIEL